MVFEIMPVVGDGLLLMWVFVWFICRFGSQCYEFVI